jgi:hypothetical protein
MNNRAFHANRSVFSASVVVETIATALAAIKHEDRLTYSDLGAILGKSEDQAAKYCDGSATMDAVTFARGKREWCSRFTGGLDRLCQDSRPGSDADRERSSKVLRAALALSIALEDDDEITAIEVRQNRATIEAARDALGELLCKLTVQAA